MSEISIQNGRIHLFGLSAGVSSVADVQKIFGPPTDVQSFDGGKLFAFLDGDLVAAVHDQDNFISTLNFSAEIGDGQYVPQTLEDARSVFPGLKIPEKESSGLLLAECPGVKLTCDMAKSPGKIIWLELHSQSQTDSQ